MHNRSHVGQRSARAASGVRSSAGSRNSRSSTACTSVPRTWAAVGTSGNRSIARNRYSSGHCLKSFARDGESAGRRGTSSGSPDEAPSGPAVHCVCAMPVTVGQGYDSSGDGADLHGGENDPVPS